MKQVKQNSRLDLKDIQVHRLILLIKGYVFIHFSLISLVYYLLGLNEDIGILGRIPSNTSISLAPYVWYVELYRENEAFVLYWNIYGFCSFLKS